MKPVTEWTAESFLAAEFQRKVWERFTYFRERLERLEQRVSLQRDAMISLPPAIRAALGRDWNAIVDAAAHGAGWEAADAARAALEATIAAALAAAPRDPPPKEKP